MKTYTVTAFDKGGNILLNKQFTAASEIEAKTQGEQLLIDNNMMELTHRCISSSGKLLLFHS
ncbi:YhzD family protein [Ectobacillus polymachus]|uniref:YhzD family protein n=1 Tax=Ectobacillus polymachus TaxID=1508806 RepID=UPI003A88E558